MKKKLYVLIAILFLTFPCLAYGELSTDIPLYGDNISNHGKMQIEPAVQSPGTNGWQKKKKDITFEHPLLMNILDISYDSYKPLFQTEAFANPHLFLTPHFYQGSYLSLFVI